MNSQNFNATPPSASNQDNVDMEVTEEELELYYNKVENSLLDLVEKVHALWLLEKFNKRNLIEYVSTERFADIIDRTMIDLDFVRARQNPPLPSCFKVAGLFIGHAMEGLPIRLKPDTENIVNEERESNAAFAILVGMSFINIDERHDGEEAFTSKNLREDDWDMIRSHILFLLAERRMPGEAVGIFLKALVKSNRQLIDDLKVEVHRLKEITGET